MADAALDADELDQLAALAVALAREAGALLLDGQPRGRLVVETKTTGTDMVTEMDRASEALLVAGIRSARPVDAILGEEGGERPGTSGVRWVIDPLDGTTNYLYGHPTWCVSIAVEADGEPVVGVVHDPSHDELFVAGRGQGASRNGTAVGVSACADLATALVGTGFAYRAEDRGRQAALLPVVLPAVRDIRRGGSAALDLCGVACGRLDAFYEQGLQPWDLAAGAFVVRQAGGETRLLPTDEPARPVLMAAPAPLLGPLTTLLEDALDGGRPA
jgi:myo-inositol-1(or 4)-monophosphatase